MTPWEKHVRGFGDDDKKEIQNGVSDSSKSGMGVLRWRYCVICKMNAPPRAHHCTLCDRCILKRDHHCYMSGVCIGYYNQRYFIVLNFYIAIASLVGLYFIYIFASETFLPRASWSDLFLPLTIWQWAWNSGISMVDMFIVFQLRTLWWTGFTALAFFSWQIILLVLGKTDHEVKKKTKVRYTGTIRQSFRSVFGLCWPVNFILPAV